MITSLALAGTLCVPAQGVTGVQQKEKQNDKKSSYSVGLPPKEKVAIGVAGIVGVGVILEEVLRHTVFAKKDKNCGEITDQEYTEMRKHFMKIATKPRECKAADFEKYTVNKLKGYILAELIEWFKAMAKYYEVESNPPETPPSDQSIKDRGAFARDWNLHFPDLLCAEHAEYALLYVLHKIEAKDLKDYLEEIASRSLDLNLLKVEPPTIYKWKNGMYRENESAPWPSTNVWCSVNADDIALMVTIHLECLLTDCSKPLPENEDPGLDKEWAKIVADVLTTKTDFTRTLWYGPFIDLIEKNKVKLMWSQA